MQDPGKLGHVRKPVDPAESALGFEQGVGHPLRSHLRLGSPAGHAPDFGADVPERVLDAVGIEQGFVQRTRRTQAMNRQEFVPRFFEADERLGILALQEIPQILKAFLGGLQPLRLAQTVEEPFELPMVATR